LRPFSEAQSRSGGIAPCYYRDPDDTVRPTRAMLTRISIALLAFIFIGVAPLQAQDPPAGPSAPNPIATDRPAVTNSSVVVPAGSFQMENGFLSTFSQGQNILDGSESLFRFGLLSRTELRISVPDYYYNLNAGGLGSGFGDSAIGVKQQLGPAPGGFDVSATVFISFPTGAKPVSSGGYDPELQVAWSRGLSSKWTAAGMFSLYCPTQGNTRNFTGESAFLIDRQLMGPWDAFVEYVGDFPERGGPRHLLHFGTAFKLTNRQQLDFHFGVGLSSAAVDHFIGIGYSFRFQVFHR
jgi:hypothetical protein